MARTVTDAAHLLQAIAGDAVLHNKPADIKVPVYADYLKKDAFQGVNLVVPWNMFEWEKDPEDAVDKAG
jgi:Asp-tRNA(Asn)/Glu-tRNA(Gln) amidotransferase A subunit family amidase